MGVALLLAGLVASAALAGRFGRPGAVLLALWSIAWLAGNRNLEGPLLHQFSATHGLVASDLAGLTGLLVAILILVFPPRAR